MSPAQEKAFRDFVADDRNWNWPSTAFGILLDEIDRLRTANKEPSAALKNPATLPGAQTFKDLLEACKRVVHEMEDWTGELSIGAIEDCKNAIRKAEEER